MILLLITIVAILQVILYILADKFIKPWVKWIVFFLILSFNFALFPAYFIDKMRDEEGEIRCGTPAMAITLGFWIVGNGATICTHITYWFLNRKNRE